ncbi:hypothetical protein FH609_017380 [Streptomyces sp. 3MP-14]|uniref:Uncharacterized protein n=1 Tax=Streptomyces mimosae TaxID=2586635 RepID=A0A5N6AAP8_9ACTN|nr:MULTISPECIES: hypothetical protein [Streptomyces]KAB8165332.1 hypothetical protein FH607_014705 [Streptomyces mimosae]KAB8175964.1 hypothetical protein FH609_017380 [Streptomyces sp. 3MP-14]
MGDYFQTVVDLDATESGARAVADAGLAWLVGEGIVAAELTDCVLGAPLGHAPGPRWGEAVVEDGWKPSDGLKVIAGRTVFNAGQGEPWWAMCPHCAVPVDLSADTAWEPFRDAIETWDDTGRAAVACSGCGRTGDLTAWAWSDNYFAFAWVGFEFWNWPEFRPDFLERFARALEGHRTVLVGGKL